MPYWKIMMKVGIIEDEAAARKELEALLADREDITLIGVATGMSDSVQLLAREDIDLVFMDINLNDCTAFDILDKCKSITAHIIFVTAYDQYAIKAIKYGAFDYLLKPIDELELNEAIKRFFDQKKTNISGDQLEIAKKAMLPTHDLQHIALPSLGSVRIVMLSDIRYCQGDGPYAHFHLVSGKKETVSKPLKYYEGILPDDIFVRTHQSYIVNTTLIQSIHRNTSIIMDNGDSIPISFRRKNVVMQKLIRK